MNEDTNEIEQISYGKELLKSFGLSVAMSVGVLTGFIIVGFAINKVDDYRNARKAKNDQVDS